MACCPISTIYCVFHLRDHVFDGISICIICSNDGVYNILQRSVLYSEQTWHTVCCPSQTKLLTPTQYSSEYLFIMNKFSSITSQSMYKRIFMRHSVPVSLCAIFNPLQPSICYSNATKQTDSQKLACSQTM